MFRRLNAGYVPGFAPISCDLNDPDSIKCGLVKRLCRDLPVAEDGFYESFSSFVLEWCKRKLDPLTRIMSFDEWIETLKFPVARINQYKAAFDRLNGSVPSKRQCQHIDTFGKSECYEELKQPRLINSRCDAFKVFSGPIFKSIEVELYKLPMFVKHLSIQERMNRILSMEQSGMKYYVSDYKAYESHFTPELMSSCECVLYRYMCSDSSDINLICNTLCGKNRLRTRTGIKCVVEGRRMSGDMCTSLGNGFTNYMLFLYVMSRHGYSEEQVDGIVEGDDGLFAVPLDVDVTARDYERCGMTIDVTRVEHTYTASFCKLIFGQSRQVIRDPFRFLSKFGWTSSFLDGSPKIMDELLKAKCLSAVYETPHCPIIGVLVRVCLSYLSHVRPRYVFDSYHELVPETFDIEDFCPTTETRLLFQTCFGIDVNAQLLCENLIRGGSIEELGRVLGPLCCRIDSAWYNSRYVC